MRIVSYMLPWNPILKKPNRIHRDWVKFENGSNWVDSLSNIWIVKIRKSIRTNWKNLIEYSNGVEHANKIKLNEIYP